MLKSNCSDGHLALKKSAKWKAVHRLAKGTLFVVVTLMASGCAAERKSSNGFFDLAPSKQFSAVELDSANRSSSSRVAQVSYEQAKRVSNLAPGQNLTDRIRQANGNVLIDFYAEWCGPCRTQGKLLHKMTETAAQNSVTIIKVDIDAHQDLAAKFNVKSLPTLLRVEDGKVVERKTGLAKQGELEKMLQGAAFGQ